MQHTSYSTINFLFFKYCLEMCLGIIDTKNVFLMFSKYTLEKCIFFVILQCKEERSYTVYNSQLSRYNTTISPHKAKWGVCFSLIIPCWRFWCVPVVSLSQIMIILKISQKSKISLKINEKTYNLDAEVKIGLSLGSSWNSPTHET